MKKGDQFMKVVEWSDEDQCYIGRIPGIGGGCHGDDEMKVYAEICQIAEEWAEIYEQDGRPFPGEIANRDYSGKFNLRIDPELHRTLAIKASLENKSLNTYAAELLSSAGR